MKKAISCAAFILTLITTNASFANSENETYAPIKSSKNSTKATYDLQFLDTMIAHERQGIEMYEMAAEKSQTEEVKNRAILLIDSEEDNISKLQTVRDEVQESAPEAVNIGLKGMMSSDLRSLNSQSAKNFDEKFLKATIKHKEASRDMAKDASKRAKNARVKEVGNEIYSSEVGELATLKEMVKKQ